MIGRVRVACDNGHLPEPSGPHSGVVECCERSKRRIGSGIAVGKERRRQVNANGSDIRGTRLEVPKIMIDSKCVTANVAVAEILPDPGDRWQLRLVAGRLCRDVLLKARQ